MDAYVNLATSTVATAPSPATSGTSLVVAAGTGVRYPAVPFDVTLYAPGTKPDPTNAEIARCTARSTDTLTLARAQYGTTAQPVAVGWYVDNDVTANFIGEMVALIPSPASTVVGPDSFGASAVVGTGTTFARADHNHGLPAAPSLSSLGGMATATYDPAAIAQQVVGTAAAQTITNKRVTKRALALSANSATPAINTDSYDVVNITAQTAAITGFTMTGTPVDGDTLRVSITGTAAVGITWGASFEASTIALPTTTVTTARLDIGFFWNSGTSKWRCVATC